jgi:hypothetical protein
MTSLREFSAEPLSQIDRLVSGDLPEAERRNLLAWLDEDPVRWRRCAMAFLEVQVWQQAAEEGSGFGVQGSDGATEGVGLRGQVSERGSVVAQARGATRPAVTTRQTLAIAALVLLALALGAIAGRRWPAAPTPLPAVADQQPAETPPELPPSDSTEPLVATVALKTNLDPRLEANISLPVTPQATAPLGEPSIPDYVRKQWEKRGFEVVEEVRYLPARLPDGSQVMVPVNKVQLKYRGTPVS